MNAGELILTLSCPDRRGIVYAIARAIADGGGNIVDSQQFGDPDEGVFFMRVHFADDRGTGTSLLPMGSLYEAAQLIFFDLVSILLRERSGQTPEEMRARHTNLE